MPTPPSPAPQPSPPLPGGSFNDRILRWLIAIPSGVATGAMLASLPLVDRGPAGKMIFRWHWAAIPLMAFGLVVGIWFWVRVFRFDSDDELSRKRALRRGGFALALLGAIAFLYPIRFVESDQRSEVFTGLGLAILVLSAMGVLIWKTIRWVSENEPKDGEIE